MIVDSSAIVAVLLEEPGYEILLNKMRVSANVAVSAPTVTEILIVLRHRLNRDPVREVMALLNALGTEIIPMTEDHCFVAAKADSKFGKGRHPAALNFGDCLAYAAATVADQSLLYKGNDFSQTDIVSA